MNIFTVAKRILEEKGWIQCYGQTKDGVCLMQVIHLACIETGTNIRVAREQIAGIINVGALSIWNDSVGRTKEEVMIILTKAEEL